MANHRPPPSHASGQPSSPDARATSAPESAQLAFDADTLLGREHWRIIAEHSVGGIPVLPGALFVQLADAARGSDGDRAIGALSFHEPVFFDTERPPRIEVVYARDAHSTSQLVDAGPEPYQFTIRAGGRDVSRGRIAVADRSRTAARTGWRDTRARLADNPTTAAEPVYRDLRSRGNTYGNAFQRLTDIRLGSERAASTLRLPQDAEATLATTLGIDAAVQLLAISAEERAGMFVLEGIDYIELVATSGANALYVERTADDEPGRITGRAWLVDQDGQLSAWLDGIRIRFQAEAQTPETLAIAATFTAEPLVDGLDFWMKQLDRPARPVFAPFNQVFQELLNPDSMLARNQRGANVLLVRLEDWLAGRDRLSLRVSDEERERILTGHQRMTLPNQLEIAHLNDYETNHLYQEIFLDRVYGQRGIHLPDDACVVDVGANVGMFSMWVHGECEQPRVFAVEPAPEAFAALSANLSMYTEGVTALACGLSDRDGEAEFTYYHNSSVFSGFKADTAVDGQAIRTIVTNVVQQAPAPAAPLAAAIDASDDSVIDNAIDSAMGDVIDDMLAERTASTTLMRPIKRLSSVIRAHNIDCIDLLKIDAEKSELDILAGIDDADWPKIRQLVLEIHDAEGTLLGRVRDLLIDKGFATVDVVEDVFQGSGFRNLYARRGDIASAAENRGHTEDRVATARDRLDATIDEFVTALTSFTTRSSVPLVVAICPPSPRAAKHADVLGTSERRLLDGLAARGRAAPTQLFAISSTEVIADVGAGRVHDSESERLGAIPYTQLLFAALATRIARWLRARSTLPKKLIVLDCDQTLWRGVCGEDGALGVEITPPYAHLHSFARRQREQGVLLALCSKNREDDVRAVFADNPGMILEWDEFSARAINWLPKSQNIHALVGQLSLGLDSVVVLDDNPVECAEISANCPGVIALPIPQDAARIPDFLDNLWVFDRLAVTDEDRVRAERYRQEQERKEFRETSSSFSDFLDSLQLEVVVAEPTSDNLPRMSQLTQRTNQFNFTTIRRTQAEVLAYLERPTTMVRVITVRDRFGEYGLVGLLLCEAAGEPETESERRLRVDTFLLSCRVLGRGVEHHLVAALADLARTAELGFIDLHFRETARNEPARRFLDSLVDARVHRAEDDGQLTYRLSVEDAARVEFIPREPELGADVALDAAKPPQTATQAPSDQRQARAGSSADEAKRLVDIATRLSRPADVLAAINAEFRRARPILSSRFTAPSSDLERALTRAWQEVLGLEQVGVDDNFFELGGNSLKAVQLVARLRGGVAPAITIVSLFEHPTVRQLTRMLDPAAAQESRQKVQASSSRGAKRKAKKRAKRRRSAGKKPSGSGR